MPATNPDRRLLLASVAGLLLATLGACQQPEPMVRVAGNSWVGYAPLYLARELGYFNLTNLRLLELAARSSALANSPGQFEQLLAGYFQALAMLQKSPSQAATVMAPTLGISAAELLTALQGVHMMNLADNRRLLVGTPPGLEPVARYVSALMLRSGLLNAGPSLDALTDERFLPTA